MQNVGRPLAAVRAFPKLYNAKQRIQVSRGLLPAQLDFFRKNPLSETWRTQVSQDIVDFVDKVELDETGKQVNELLPQEKIRLFQNPAKYFSRPHNVPESARKQTYFPEFTVTLVRTPHLGPRFAQFKVPLWFGKLNLKYYLKNLYNVDVLHIRSFVIHRRPSNKPAANRFQRGQRVQPSFKKKMTVQLAEPFIWPEELSTSELDNQDHDKTRYWDSSRDGLEHAKREQAEFNAKPDEKHRKSIAEQAKLLLAGKAEWQPTWQQLPHDVKILKARNKRASLPVPTSMAKPSSSTR